MKWANVNRQGFLSTPTQSNAAPSMRRRMLTSNRRHVGRHSRVPSSKRLVHSECFRLLGSISMLGVLFTTALATAGDNDRYSYSLQQGSHEAVCQHMRAVYNQNFSHPWRRPPLTKLEDDPSYGPDSAYAYPKDQGVVHSSAMTFDMTYSRLPTSPEFEAINWRERRIQHGQPIGDSPALVATVDIDNDGKPDTVVKGGFMRSHATGVAGGGQDALYIFRHESTPLPSPIPPQMLGAKRADGGPAVITETPDTPYRLIRPFLYRGTTYLAAYGERERGGRWTEVIWILRYLKGGYIVGPAERTKVEVSRICKIQMNRK